MMPTKELEDVLKAVLEATSLSGLSTLFVNSSGKLSKGVMMKESLTGANIAGQGVWLIVVYSKTNPSQLNASLYVKNSMNVAFHTIINQNLSLVHNEYGSVALASGVTVQNAVFVALRLSMGSV